MYTFLKGESEKETVGNVNRLPAWTFAIDSKTTVPFPGNISNFFFDITSLKCVRACFT